MPVGKIGSMNIKPRLLKQPDSHAGQIANTIEDGRKDQSISPLRSVVAGAMIGH